MVPASHNEASEHCRTKDRVVPLERQTSKLQLLETQRSGGDANDTRSGQEVIVRVQVDQR